MDFVIHFVALKSIVKSVSNPLKYPKSNIYGILNIFCAIQKHKSHNLIFGSSATVCGLNGNMPNNEDVILITTNLYVHLKIYLHCVCVIFYC
ncbi:GDP-mannose 4,6-dehydratase [Citrobacter freundii]|nr:GDP-mannose 4,6-dehydratase [Citrobacter freundii]